jgi:hypothetical protein
MDARLLFLVIAAVGISIVIRATLQRPRTTKSWGTLAQEMADVPPMIVVTRRGGSYTALCPQALGWTAKARSLDDLLTRIDQHPLPLSPSLASPKLICMWEDDGFRNDLPGRPGAGSLPGAPPPNSVGFTVEAKAGGYQASGLEGLDLAGWAPNLETLTSTMRNVIIGRFPNLTRNDAPKVVYVLERDRAA